MNSASSAPASFLNVDLELGSDDDLLPIKEYLASSTFALYCEQENDRYHLVLEAVIDGLLNTDPVKCLDHLLCLVETLPPDLMQLWRNCHYRIFDIGFDGGYESVPFRVDLQSDLLKRIVQVGGSIKMRIYPYYAGNATEEHLGVDDVDSDAFKN